jgi:hypothetical protein
MSTADQAERSKKPDPDAPWIEQYAWIMSEYYRDGPSAEVWEASMRCAVEVLSCEAKVIIGRAYQESIWLDAMMKDKVGEVAYQTDEVLVGKLAKFVGD